MRTVIEKIEAAAAEAEQLSSNPPNNSKDWWLSRMWALRYALDLLEEKS